MSAVPGALANACDQWINAGRPGQVPTPWNPQTWRNRLLGHGELFSQLGTSPVDRRVPTTWAADVSTTRRAVDAFIVAMVWGYGPVGYGAFRTARVMAETPDFPSVIKNVAEVAITDGGVAAYEYVGQQRGHDPTFLKYLGPAFGTKFIYFVTKANRGDPAPIMDSVVCRWFEEWAPSLRVRLDWSEPAGYCRYVEQLNRWAEDLSARHADPIAVDDVEYLIFCDRATHEGSSSWSVPWMRSVSAPKAGELLEQLEVALAQHPRMDEVRPHLDALDRLVLELDER